MGRVRRILTTLAAVALLTATALPALAQQQDEPYPPGEAVLAIEKFVEDEDDPAVFDFAVDCDAAGTFEFALGHDDTETITVPIGDVCTITELGVDPLDVAFVVAPQDALVSEDPDGPSVTVEVVTAAGVLVQAFNAFDEVLGPAALELEKDLAATSESSRRSFAGLGFDFRVECATVDEVVTLVPGESFRWEGIPVGTQCVISETETHGAVATRITVRVDGQVVRSLDGTEVVVDFPTEDDVLVQVLFMNTVAEVRTPPPTPKATPTPTPVRRPFRDVTDVLARTGFDLTWGMLLGLGLVLSGGTAVYASRRRRRR